MAEICFRIIDWSLCRFSDAFCRCIQNSTCASTSRFCRSCSKFKVILIIKVNWGQGQLGSKSISKLPGLQQCVQFQVKDNLCVDVCRPLFLKVQNQIWAWTSKTKPLIEEIVMIFKVLWELDDFLRYRPMSHTNLRRFLDFKNQFILKETDVYHLSRVSEISQCARGYWVMSLSFNTICQQLCQCHVGLESQFLLLTQAAGTLGLSASASLWCRVLKGAGSQ